MIRRLFAGERLRAERTPTDVLLERAIVATGYDLAVLGRPGTEAVGAEPPTGRS